MSHLPARVEVPKRVCDIATHRGHNCPFAAQVFDEDVRQEHGGYDDGGIDDTQRDHAHALLSIQAALVWDTQNNNKYKEPKHPKPSL